MFNKVERLQKSEIPLKVYLFYRSKNPLRGSVDASMHEPMESRCHQTSILVRYKPHHTAPGAIETSSENCQKKRPVRPVRPKSKVQVPAGRRRQVPSQRPPISCDATMAMGGTTGLCFCTMLEGSIPTVLFVKSPVASCGPMVADEIPTFGCQIPSHYPQICL